MTSRQTSRALAACLVLLGAPPTVAAAQRARPVAVQSLATAESSDVPLAPPVLTPVSVAREERIIAGALIGAGVGAVAAYVVTHYGSARARKGTSDVHEMDFIVYVYYVPAGAALGAIIGATSGALP